MHIHPKKSLGQNFLTDPRYVHKIADAAVLTRDDQVLEIGPGLGHLTVELAARAGKVLAVELDDRVLPVLREQFARDPHVELRRGDAMLYPYESLAGSWKVVANLPYYIATPLIQRLLENRERFSSITIMVQKEVGERIAASPGGKEYGYLSVLVRYYTMPRIAFTVPAGAFTPRPKIDSAVLTLTVRERPAIDVADVDFFFRVVKAAFSQRRKTLRNSLGQLGLNPRILQEAERLSGIALGRRAETLSVEEFGLLAKYLGLPENSPR